MAYKVTAPLVITKHVDGSDLYLYQGAVLPDFVGGDELDRLVDEKFVVKLDEPAQDDGSKKAPEKQTPAKPPAKSGD